MHRIVIASALLLSVVVRLHALDEADLKDAAGKPVLHYAIEVPKDAPPASITDPAKQLGLFLCYHEHDGKAGDEAKTVLATLGRLKQADGFVVIGVHHEAHQYSKEDHQNTALLIAWALKTYAINPRRVYNFGRGEGATMSAEFALEHPDLIACAITYSWGFRFMPDNKEAETALPSLYIVLGQKDTPTHLPMVRGTYAKAKPKGYHIIYREFEDRGPSVHPPTNDDSVTWAIASRNKVLPLSAKELELLKPIANTTAAHAVAASGSVWNGIVLVGGPQAGSLVSAAFGAKSEEAKLMAIKSCQAAVYGEATMTALAEVLKDKDSSAVKAAIESLGVNAGWGSVAASKALAEFAGTPKKGATDERGAAVDAIGQAVKLQIHGHQQDIVLFKALVGLLDDEEGTLRAKAFAILSPILPDSGYKPEGAKADRKAGIGKWEDWLKEATGKEPGAG